MTGKEIVRTAIGDDALWAIDATWYLPLVEMIDAALAVEREAVFSREEDV